MLRRLGGIGWIFLHVQLSPVAPCRGRIFFCGIPELRSVCKMCSSQAPRYRGPLAGWLVRTLRSTDSEEESDGS